MSTENFGVYADQTKTQAGLVARSLGLLYALVSYLIGALALFWLFFAAGGWVPYALSGFKAESAMGALLVNLGLVLIFAIQHTVMARQGFKQWLTKFIPEALERSTYVLLSGIAIALLVWFWQPLPGSIWNVESQAGFIIIQAIYAAGILYVLLSSLITNHFELFGLRQAWLYFRNKPYTEVPFKRVWFYRFSRHPLMLGVLIILWATPEMTVTRLCLAVLMTIYIFAGIKFEENDLLRAFGDQYRRYRDEVGLFFTLKR